MLSKLEAWADSLAASWAEDKESVRFNVMAAAYAWCSLNHGGQGSREYALLCAIPFNPGPFWSDEQELDSGENFYARETAEWLSDSANWIEEESTDNE